MVLKMFTSMAMLMLVRPVHQVLPLQGPVSILPLLKSSKGQDPRLKKADLVYL